MEFSSREHSHWPRRIAVFAVLSLVTTGSHFADGSFAGRRDPVFDQIMKDVESIRYPADTFWKRVQDLIPATEPFPCKNMSSSSVDRWRSQSRPESVHRLRPGDIDVIGAMGDSLTCGSGAREFLTLGIVVQDRGVSFSGGGTGTWRQILTMPNILKVFNPKLVGYSTGRGDFFSYNAQLNVAIPAALDDDALSQAKIFVAKMRRDHRVNYQADWKLLSIFFGQNDVCSCYCFDREKHSPEAHRVQLEKALDYLYLNVPRLFVNIISMLDTSITERINRSLHCRLASRTGCPCMFWQSSTQQGVVEMSRIAQKYQQIEKDVAASQRYNGRQDFTVEWQPFFHSLNLPESNKLLENSTILRQIMEEPIWTPDCIHFNQRGMALFSKMLWNNMLEPVGNKSKEYPRNTLKDIICPTETAPYIFTKVNSQRYYNYGRQ